MKKNFFIFLGIFTSLAASRFIPHPPNFTSLLALSFYVPVFFGLRYLPVLLISFAITDLVIGYHSGTHWTWGSVFLIGLISPLFAKNIKLRTKTGGKTGRQLRMSKPKTEKQSRSNKAVKIPRKQAKSNVSSTKF